MNLLDSPRRRWFILAVGWVILLVLGIGGFLQQSQEANLHRSFLDNLYLTLQLAALDYSGGGGDLNWRLQVARFAAPVMALGTVAQAASVVFRDEFTRWRLRFLKGHIVVCGLGGTGTRLALALAEDGQRVVGLGAATAAPGLATLGDHGIPTLVGDPTDPDVLLVVRADRASRVVAITDDDARNVGVAAACLGLPRDERAPALRCSVQLSNSDLVELLRVGELGGARRAVRVEFFDLYATAARALLSEWPVAGDGSRAPHLVILGLGELGRSVVVAAAQQWAESGRGPLPMTLVDRAASGRWQALRLLHPALDAAVEPRCVDLDLESATEQTVESFASVLGGEPPTLVAVLFDRESLALSTAILTQRTIADPTVPIVVRTQTDAGLVHLVAPADPTAGIPFPGLVVFPFLDRACSPELIEGGVREQIARALHEDHALRSGGTGALHRPWRHLSDADRESSRRSADATVDGLGRLGYEVVPLHRWGVFRVPLTDREIDQLAREEHERWREERLSSGWRYGPNRDDAQRTNPLLVDWADLPPASQDLNRDGIAGVPSLLARAGLEISRR